MYICMGLRAVILRECCYLDGIDRKYCAISLKIYQMCVCVCLYCRHENRNYRVLSSINLCEALNTHKIVGLLEVT
jgi:hypothetical protein